MIIKLQQRENMFTCISYLAGPGNHDEHTDHRVVWTNHPLGPKFDITGSGSLAEKDAAGIAERLSKALRIHGSRKTFKDKDDGDKRKRFNFFHGEMSVHPDAKVPDEQTWAKAVERYLDLMEWSSTKDGYFPAIAVTHGPGRSGNHHVHFVVSAVSTDGVMLNDSRWKARSHKAKLQIEDELGLPLEESERHGRSRRPYTKGEIRRQKLHGRNVKESELLRRNLLTAAIAANCEGEFVEFASRIGLELKPRFSDGKVGGFSVRIKGDESCPWYAAGKLSRHLSLPVLRSTMSWESGFDSRQDALAAWRGARSSGGPSEISNRRFKACLDRYRFQVEKYRNMSTKSPGWYMRAKEVSGVLSVLSCRIEGDQPDVIFNLSQELFRAAETVEQLPDSYQVWRNAKTCSRFLLTTSAFSGGEMGAMLAILVLQIGLIKSQRIQAEELLAAQRIETALGEAVNILENVNVEAVFGPKPTPELKVVQQTVPMVEQPSVTIPPAPAAAAAAASTTTATAVNGPYPNVPTPLLPRPAGKSRDRDGLFKK